jgi:hypothetical protein
MEHKGSPQEPTIGPYPEPDKISPHPYIHFFSKSIMILFSHPYLELPCCPCHSTLLIKILYSSSSVCTKIQTVVNIQQGDALSPLGRYKKTRWDWNWMGHISFTGKQHRCYREKTQKQKRNSVASVHKRTVPTEQPPLIGEVIANFCR